MQMLESVARSAAEVAFWIAATNVKPIEERAEAVAEWMRQAEESGVFSRGLVTSGPKVDE